MFRKSSLASCVSAALRCALMCALIGAPLAAADLPFLVVVDLSRSINVGDPHHYTVDAVQLAVATLRSGKEMEVLGFAEEASVLLPWSSFPTLADRARARDTLTNRLQFTGFATHYLKALQLAYSELEAKVAPFGTRVVFITDGPPDDDPHAIIEQAQKFAEHGWIIDAVRLVAKADDTGPVLGLISDVTRGNHVDVSTADDLIQRFVMETSAENDYFLLSLQSWSPDAPMAIPTGTDRLFLIAVTAKRPQHRGDFTAFQQDGVPVALDDSTSYQYPRADKTLLAEASLGCVEWIAPPAGTYLATFDGRPQAVYVGLALGARVVVQPIPAAVDEGTVVSPGVSLVVPGVDQGVLAALAKDVTVEAVITDGNATLLDATLAPVVRADRVTYAQDWPAVLAANADRAHTHYLAVTYHVIDRQQYHLDKNDGFAVNPHAGGPPPQPPVPAPVAPVPATYAATWGQPTVDLGACWSDQGASGTLPVATSGPSGSLTFTGGDGFTFPAALATPGTGSLAYAFSSTVGGHHHGTFAAAGLPAVTTPELSIDNYPWTGSDRVALTGAGQTGIPAMSPGASGLAAQPMQAFTVPLTSSDGGATVAVAIDADGVATLTPPIDGLPPAVFAGAASVHFGNLPARNLNFSLRRDRPATVMKWGEGKLQADEKLDPAEARMEGGDGPIRIKEPHPGVWKPEAYLEAQVPMALASGMSGTWKVILGDLAGPEGETLSAAYDLRASIDQPHLAAGDVTTLHVRVLRPRKVPSGDYSGNATIVFTPDQGDPERFTRPIVVTLP